MFSILRFIIKNNWNNDINTNATYTFEDYLAHIERWEELKVEAKIILLEVVKRIIQEKIDELKRSKKEND